MNETFLICGLGNPGKKYVFNRHNIGFMLVEKIADRFSVKFSRLQFNALVTDFRYNSNKVILAKPRTFMNASGNAVSSLMRFYKIPQENLILAYDDVDLEFDSIRLRPSGGSGGHKGVKSTIERLGSGDFNRIRLGIGRPKGRMDTPAHVLQDFSRDEQDFLPAILDTAAEAALAIIDDGIDQAMNDFNARKL